MLKNNTSQAQINKSPPIGVIGPRKDKEIPSIYWRFNR